MQGPNGMDGVDGADGGQCRFGSMPRTVTFVTDVQYGSMAWHDHYPPLRVATGTALVCPCT